MNSAAEIQEAGKILIDGFDREILPRPFAFAGQTFWDHRNLCRCRICCGKTGDDPMSYGLVTFHYNPIQYIWRTYSHASPDPVNQSRDGAAFILCDKYLNPAKYIAVQRN